MKPIFSRMKFFKHIMDNGVLFYVRCLLVCVKFSAESGKKHCLLALYPIPNNSVFAWRNPNRENTDVMSKKIVVRVLNLSPSLSCLKLLFGNIMLLINVFILWHQNTRIERSGKKYWWTPCWNSNSFVAEF